MGWGIPSAQSATVYVSRFWHNHQPLYWPEWNGNGNQTERIQYAWDSICLKNGQTYDTGTGHPDNNLTDIFGNADRVSAYQGRPRDSLASINGAGGFAISYSGSLIDNVRSLGANSQMGYHSGWADGNREARGWKTPSGSSRLDLVGFTYHHSLGCLLPKAVFRKEIQMFKQAWWKAWGGNSDMSDHSKGFFPTEMAYSTEMVDVLADEGYDWVIVASHHLSRTCPTYNDYVTPTSFNIKSSPPNRADQTGPSPASGWWFSEPNPGQAAWNVSPYAYQLHNVKYVNPSTGAEKTMVAVPSDDALSYKAGYSGAEMGMISGNIAPYATDPNNPVIVMPATDGDNAWGGGYDSWMVSTPSFFGSCASAGYQICAVQDLVNAHPPSDTVHVEDGAWIFPESCYGSPYYLKWVEPPLNTTNASMCYPYTKVDLETPGFALKFWSWAAVMAGANWCETAEQIWKDKGGTVEAWKIQAPYDWDGTHSSPNIVERAWHIYLGGLDSGFNYYGGLGNDDEVKPSLATRRAYEMLATYVNANVADDRTPPTVFRPQRFPWNPGGYTFGWFNSYGSGTNASYLKKMPSEFYIWTHVYDVSDVANVRLKVRMDADGSNPLSNNQNETYAGGGDVSAWITIPMTMRELPDTREELNAAAGNGQIDYFITPPVLADYYFAKITDSNVSGFRGKLIDYYIEAVDTRGNTNRTDIQHVFVEDDGVEPSSYAIISPDPNDCSPITVTYSAGGGDLEGVSPVYMQVSFDHGTNWNAYAMTNAATDMWSFSVSAPDNAPSISIWFRNAASTLFDSRSGLNWVAAIRDCDAPEGPGSVAFTNAAVCDPVLITYMPNAGVLANAAQVYVHVGFNGWSNVPPDAPMTLVAANAWQYSLVPASGATQLNLCFNDGGAIWDNHSGSNWNFAVTGCEEGVIPPGLVITNPASELVYVTNTTGQINVMGTAGDLVIGTLSWTNAKTGAYGTLPRATNWTISGMALLAGTNVVTVKGPSAGGMVTNSSDDASQSAYSDGWISGDNGGIGWADSWSLLGGDNAGHFIADSSSQSNMNIQSPAFGLYANNSAMAQALRSFVSPIRVGDTFSAQFENNWVTTGSSVGMALMNNSNSLFEFYFYGGDGTYRITDASGNRDTLIPWTGDGLTIAVTLTSATNYSATIGSSNFTGVLAAQTDMNIRKVRFWNYSAGAGTEYNAYFNKLLLTSPNASGELSDTVAICYTDAENDIPDWWAIQYFGCATCVTASADSDHDGFSNVQEYWMGTDPTNALSDLSIIESVITESDYYNISWKSVGGKSYDIQYIDDLMHGAFQTVITVTENAVSNGVATSRSFQDTISPSPTNGFRAYRVRLRR